MKSLLHHPSFKHLDKKYQSQASNSKHKSTMKTFLILALLAMAATMATARVKFHPSGQYQSQHQFSYLQQPYAQSQLFPDEQQQFPEQQQPFFQQQPFLQQQLPFLHQQQQPGQFDPSGQYHSQQPFPQVQQPFVQPQPFSQEQQQFRSQQPSLQQQHVQFDPTVQYQTQQPFSQIQQPFVQPQLFPQKQKQFLEQQQPYLQQQQPFFQPFLQQQLNSCRRFLLQQCSRVPLVSLLQSWILQQSSCQVTRQQCCRQLAQIPQQLRVPAIYSVVQSIIRQQQQQFFQPQQQMGQGVFQPQLQQIGQGFIQPQQVAQFEALRTSALQTLSAICNV